MAKQRKSPRKSPPTDDLVWRKARKTKYRVVADEAERILEKKSSRANIQNRPFFPKKRGGRGGGGPVKGNPVA